MDGCRPHRRFSAQPPPGPPLSTEKAVQNFVVAGLTVYAQIVAYLVEIPLLTCFPAFAGGRAPYCLQIFGRSISP